MWIALSLIAGLIIGFIVGIECTVEGIRLFKKTEEGKGGVLIDKVTIRKRILEAIQKSGLAEYMRVNGLFLDGYDLGLTDRICEIVLEEGEEVKNQKNV